MTKKEKIANYSPNSYSISQEERLLFQKYKQKLELYEDDYLDSAERIRALMTLYPGMGRADAAKIDRQANLVSNGFAIASRDELTLAFPNHAPALWSKRKTGRDVSPIDFIRQYYGEWLNQGLTRNSLRRLDRDLYQAFSAQISRLRRAGKTIPEDIECLTDNPTERVDQELQEAGIINPSDAYKKFPDDRRKADRLYQAAWQRSQKSKPKLGN